MSLYTIDQFSKITGLNKILIRTWENRYNFLTPKRSSTNIRTYDNNMLSKGIKYSILVDNGHKISKLVKYQDKYLNELLENTLTSSNDIKNKEKIYISKFIESALAFDQKIFSETYHLCTKELGIISFYKNILIETMNKISILYLNSKITSANEHFLSENIRIKIAEEICKEQHQEDKHNSWVLFLPENEYHDIGLLFTYLILKKNRRHVIYLGQNTTRESILQLKNKDRKFLFFTNTKRNQNFSEELYSFINKNLSGSHIYVIDNEEQSRKNHRNIKSIKNLDNFIDLLKSSKI
jgi:DNA-binding transcriptional MerR regulator